MDRLALIERVEDDFVGPADGLARWPDPWSDHGDTPHEAYSRVTDPGRYLTTGARVDAWQSVMTSLGWCTVEPASAADWVGDHRGAVARSDRWIPTIGSARSLVVDRTVIDGDPVGVTLGAGRPTTFLWRFPDPTGCSEVSGSAWWA